LYFLGGQEKMLKNTELTYGSVAKWLHWLTALAFLLAYVLVYYLHWILNSEGPLRSPIIRLHKAVGFSVLIFFLLRIYWRATNPQPKLPDDMPWWQVKGSHVSHFLLYFFMIVTPLSGYFGNGSGIDLGVFQIASMKDSAFGIWFLGLLNLSFEQWEVPFDYFHYHIAGPLLLWMLIALHAGAALYHHFVHKDDVLKRMLPSSRGSSALSQ
jgi:cytochrome b561